MTENRLLKKILFLLLFLTLQSCWVCPDKHSLEYTKSSKTIKIVDEDFYIESIRIEDIGDNHKDFIDYKDSSYVEFTRNENRGYTEVSLNDIADNYGSKGAKNVEAFLKKEKLFYTITIESFGRNKESKESDVIRFTSDELNQEKNIIESNHPCP